MRQQPEDTLRQLFELFPEFSQWWEDEVSEEARIDGVHMELTHHRVLMEFLGFFGKCQKSFDEAQLRAFGAWVDRAMVPKGDLEEAVRSCLLERTHEAHIDRLLGPYLSRKAKSKSDV